MKQLYIPKGKTVTREEAIRILEPEFVANKFAKYDEEHGTRDVEQLKAIYAACILAVEALREQEERRWIPVAERLPKLIPSCAGTAYSEAVNVLTTGRKVLTAIYDGNDFIADAEFWDAEGEEITHWTPVLLPLPESPKEEGT